MTRWYGIRGGSNCGTSRHLKAAKAQLRFTCLGVRPLHLIRTRPASARHSQLRLRPGAPPVGARLHRIIPIASVVQSRIHPSFAHKTGAFGLVEQGGSSTGLWLGHESIETTNAYVHANLAMKEKALAKVLPMDTPFRRFHADDRLLAFLESI